MWVAPTPVWPYRDRNLFWSRRSALFICCRLLASRVPVTTAADANVLEYARFAGVVGYWAQFEVFYPLVTAHDAFCRGKNPVTNITEYRIASDEFSHFQLLVDLDLMWMPCKPFLRPNYYIAGTDNRRGQHRLSREAIPDALAPRILEPW